MIPRDDLTKVYDRLERYADGWRDTPLKKVVNEAVENATDLDILVKYIEADANMLNKVLAEIRTVARYGDGGLLSYESPTEKKKRLSRMGLEHLIKS